VRRLPLPAPQARGKTWTIADSVCEPHHVDDLTPAERREYEAQAHDARRRDWLAGRRAAKEAVAAHCGVEATRVRLVRREGAAPNALLRDGGATSRGMHISISISHCDGRGVAAVADHPARVGVDLERGGQIDGAHLRYFLSPAEWLVAERVGATLVWTLKEAAWKALQLDDATPFSALRLAIDRASELRGVWLHGDWIPATARMWRVDDDLLAAAVYVGPTTSGGSR
jgi:4'-phosphopantetheinyl transferase EntD